ncbi:PaaI family thioesterase [candidate division WOR-3 bacterium]|nr:PaaI family thioesterase [candidate division WOR-3 bacterium]
MTTESSSFVRIPLSHRHCRFCGEENPASLGLKFKTAEDGCVYTEFECEKLLQGYEGYLHGGIICSLLDCAMTHCLFNKNVSAFTAELNVRFLKPVPVDSKLLVRACFKDRIHGMFRLKGEILTEGKLFAVADSKFMEIHKN